MFSSWLGEIILTPEKPSYNGGVWHVEGMLNESIISTGIYYYDSENISESSLEFRRAVNDPPYEQNDHQGVELVYGIHDNGKLNQYLGYLITKQDRCIAFPNIYQHRVRPFQLIDTKKPGYRKILVFFLVNPTFRILSTSNVTPQQKDFQISNKENTYMKYDDAIKHREELMKERKFMIQENTTQFYEREFSLCEH